MMIGKYEYLKRSGDEELGLGWVEENEHGFCIWRVEDGMLLLVNVYGDGKYWNEWADKKAEHLGVQVIAFGTKRNPQGFVRKYGYDIKGYILERKAKWVE